MGAPSEQGRSAAAARSVLLTGAPSDATRPAPERATTSTPASRTRSSAPHQLLCLPPLGWPAGWREQLAAAGEDAEDGGRGAEEEA
nr:unnamed protein product [Digitaria exilis]